MSTKLDRSKAAQAAWDKRKAEAVKSSLTKALRPSPEVDRLHERWVQNMLACNPRLTREDLED